MLFLQMMLLLVVINKPVTATTDVSGRRYFVTTKAKEEWPKLIYKSVDLKRPASVSPI
jgi:hypothetical protein